MSTAFYELRLRVCLVMLLWGREGQTNEEMFLIQRGPTLGLVLLSSLTMAQSSPSRL